jgi:3-phenylpropionate/trans-cinnamate dioxygenase ferredoxin subunit
MFNDHEIIICPSGYTRIYAESRSVNWLEVEMTFYKAAVTSELPTGQMMMVSVDGKEILLANVAGSYYAINNRCTHLGGSLSKGVLEGSIVTCPRHGSQFDVTTGIALHGPQIAFIKIKVRDEETYPVKIEGSDILVGIS